MILEQPTDVGWGGRKLSTYSDHMFCSRDLTEVSLVGINMTLEQPTDVGWGGGRPSTYSDHMFCSSDLTQVSLVGINHDFGTTY